MNKRIHLSIAFGDVILPVHTFEDGIDRVPLKPICDHIGVDWKGQKRKLLGSEYLTKRFGLILGEDVFPQYAGNLPKNDSYWIRVDRVEAFLNTLNPPLIRNHGNIDAADWLEAKHVEWDDAIHAYETNGYAAKSGEAYKRSALVQLDKIKDPNIRQHMTDSVNAEFGLNLVFPKQGSLDV